MSNYVVSALYHFTKLENFVEMRDVLLAVMKENEVKGTLLLALEGINGTIAGSREGIDAVVAYLKSDQRLANLTTKESFSEDAPFERTKVKLKKEIVTMGVEGIDPLKHVGEYVKPKDWNDLIAAPETIVVDTRNEYEVEIGTFKNAVNPHTDTFREFPEYSEKNLAQYDKDTKIAMFCTGGIRCEKSTAYMKSQGFENVYHLEGGILKYLEEVSEEESLWQGECFVFDERVAVKHGLEQGKYDQCYACRMPITEEDKNLSSYEKGISCKHCIGKKSDEQIAAYKERQKQMELAKQRGDVHIGGDVSDLIDVKRSEKLAKKEQDRMSGEFS